MDNESTHMNQNKEIPKQSNILIDETLQFEEEDKKGMEEDTGDGKEDAEKENEGEVRKIVIT